MDSSRSTYWLYTNTSLFELLAVEEDRDVWSAYLEKNEHAAALVYAKVLSLVSMAASADDQTYFTRARLKRILSFFRKRDHFSQKANSRKQLKLSHKRQLRSKRWHWNL
jgi:hypothetical protein